MSFFRKHPFEVQAHFESSLVLTYAIPKEALEILIPECFTLDTHDDKWAFLAVAIVKTQGLRPKCFPEFMGNDFFLIGYRIFVRYTNHAGKRLRGLFILGSETDNWKMKLLGDLFTYYNYSITDIHQDRDSSHITTTSKKSGLHIVIEESKDQIELPEESPFSTWDEARRFAGPLPHTFSHLKREKLVLIIEGVRQNWTPQPVRVIDQKIAFFEQMEFRKIVLASAFEVRDINYLWKRGKTETWPR